MNWLKSFIEDEVSVGKPFTAIRLSAVRQRLLELELFEHVEVTLRRADESVVITLKEKASFLPVPIIAASEGTTMFGVYLGEMNFLGMGKLLYFGGRYASYGTELQLGLIDPAFISRNFTLSLTMEGGGIFYTQRDAKRTVYSKYLVDKVEIVLNIGYKLSKKVQLKYASSYMDRSVRLDTGNVNDAPAAQVLYQGVEFEYDGIEYRDYMKLGGETRLNPAAWVCIS